MHAFVLPIQQTPSIDDYYTSEDTYTPDPYDTYTDTYTSMEPECDEACEFEIEEEVIAEMTEECWDCLGACLNAKHPAWEAIMDLGAEVWTEICAGICGRSKIFARKLHTAHNIHQHGCALIHQLEAATEAEDTEEIAAIEAEMAPHVEAFTEDMTDDWMGTFDRHVCHGYEDRGIGCIDGCNAVNPVCPYLTDGLGLICLAGGMECMGAINAEAGEYFGLTGTFGIAEAESEAPFESRQWTKDVGNWLFDYMVAEGEEELFCSGMCSTIGHTQSSLIS